MEIICNQNELNNALQLVSKAVATRPTHPILANILLTADQGTNKISLTGFDLNLGIQTSFDGTVKNSGAITIPSKLLSEIVNKLPIESPVSLEVDENLDTILIKSDRGSFNLKGIPSDDYPNLPFVESGTSLNIDPTSFVKALKYTIFASSNDDSKQLLTGVNFTFKQNYLESASTDGHRLAVALIGNGENVENKDKPPFMSVCASPDGKSVFAGDTQGRVLRVDVGTGKVICKYKSFTGSVRRLQVHPKLNNVLLSISIDRILRVHHIESRKLLMRMYLKQRLNAMEVY